ncbi:ATP-binding protein [Tianweitania populi]|uniref:histidine kinase n=1 Tax=Tianweitania populi TaxID=1607949 RepID=A0A8J3DXK7_9HYPH|nr:HAMP domain-containing sensor histidine kinase [Tianweitania populi]GHD20825.1 hypothetical protein GCM10016234_33660 [Tianweitania populi]
MKVTVTDWRRLLDPAGGDLLDHPHRRLRLNLRRMEAVGLLAILVAAVEASFSRYRGIPEMAWLCLALAAIALGFILYARHVQRNGSQHSKRLPDIFILFVLLASQSLGYFISMTGRLASGYGLTAMACAVFFLIPPRRFLALCLSTLAVYVTWMLLTHLSPFDKINGIFNTILAVSFATMGRWGLNHLEQTDERQKRQIAEQNATLKKVNARLHASNIELNSLMAVAAHDLRSPLYGLGNLLDLASTRPPHTKAGWQGILREARNSIAGMQALIGRILEAHEAETKQFGKLQRSDLGQSLRSAAARARSIAEHSGITIILALQPPAAEAFVEKDDLAQILDNLLSNAIRFSPLSSIVELRASGGSSPFIEVCDRGIGIPVEQRAQLFGKFQRGTNTPLNGTRGSGLGLYIVKTLANGMDAEASYRPREGGGSVFRITFRRT